MQEEDFSIKNEYFGKLKTFAIKSRIDKLKKSRKILEIYKRFYVRGRSLFRRFEERTEENEEKNFIMRFRIEVVLNKIKRKQAGVGMNVLHQVMRRNEVKAVFGKLKKIITAQELVIEPRFAGVRNRVDSSGMFKRLIRQNKLERGFGLLKKVVNLKRMVTISGAFGSVKQDFVSKKPKGGNTHFKAKSKKSLRTEITKNTVSYPKPHPTLPHHTLI